MRAIKLRLDDLHVETFATGPGQDARGTVHGHSGATCDQDTCVTCPSDLDTCVSCVQSCAVTCASCPQSCDPAQCPSADGRC